MKKLLSLILCIAIAMFAIACNPDDDGTPQVTADGKVIIYIPLGWGGGGGTAGSEYLASQFTKDPNFGGKARGNYTGAVIKHVEGSIPTTASGISSSAFDVLGFSHGAPLVSSLAEGIINLNDPYGDGSYDLMAQSYGTETKTLAEKIPSNYAAYFQSSGSYYAMPSSEQYCGMAMYTELWERDQLYIAAAKLDTDDNFDVSYYEANEFHKYHSSTFGVTIYFSDYDGEAGSNLCIGYETGSNSQCLRSGVFTADNPETSIRSVGPDGLPGTTDDGQPSTVVEFLALCEYMNSGAIKEDPRPGDGRGNDKMSYYDAITYSGQYKSSYDALFLDGFFASLAGESYNTILTLDSEGKEIEVVTGFYNEPLFPGLPSNLQHIKKPKTTKVVVTPDCGYYASWMVEKYYTDAVFEILMKGTNNNGTYFYYGNDFSTSHVEAQYDFLIGNYNNNQKQEACAYMLDGSYVNAEMRANKKLKQIELMYDSATDIRMEYASLPVNFKDIVRYNEETEEHNGDKPSLVVIGKNFTVLSKRLLQDPDKLAYCLDWLLYTRGDVNMAINYFYNSTPHVMTQDIESIIAENPTAGLETHENYNYFNRQLLKLHKEARVYKPIGGADINPFNSPNYYKRGFGSGIFYIGARDNAYTALKTNGSVATFKEQAYDKTSWGTMYNKTVTGNLTVNWTPSGTSGN